MRLQSSRVIRQDTKSLAWLEFVRLPSNLEITAGIFSEQGSQPKKKGKGAKKASKLTLIEIAACHEFGALLKDAAGEVIGEIPQRSFLRGWFDANQERIQAEFIRRLVANPPEKWRRALNQTALWIEAELKRNIRRGGTPPFQKLAKETERRKRSTKPLIDTSQLVNSILAKVDGRRPTQ
jgi:hypothetical protein